MKRIISLILSIVLVLSFAGCAAEPYSSDEGDKKGSSASEAAEVKFTFVAVDLDGNKTEKEITTDKKTVGEALLSQGIVEGEKGDYGLYVTSVNGVSLDYKKDGAYWAFYVGDNYASKGVDQTEIEPGETYMFKAEKAQ